MKEGLLFKLIKLTRAIRIFFGGYREMEEQFKLFKLDAPLTPRAIYQRLIPACYQYNAQSTTQKGEIFTVRQLTDVDHQIHLRFYEDGWITAHYELQPEMWPMEHLRGVELRSLTDDEAAIIKKLLGVE